MKPIFNRLRQAMPPSCVPSTSVLPARAAQLKHYHLHQLVEHKPTEAAPVGSCFKCCGQDKALCFKKWEGQGALWVEVNVQSSRQICFELPPLRCDPLWSTLLSGCRV
eukprot:1152522-Pelagomonas_calceolata.AAC.5